MKQIQVTDDVADILRRSKINGNNLTLPGQLSRPDYQKVMKVIDAAGGKWSRKDACHIFRENPAEVFAGAFDSGKIEDKSDRALRTSKQAFYTPQPVASMVILHAGIKDGHDVLEPSAGHGALALSARESGGIITCVETDPEACKILLGHNLSVIERDFLFEDPRQWIEFDRIVMNPPFTNGQDVEHVTHALRFLKRGGVLVAIMSPSFEFRTGRKYHSFREMMADRGSIVERLENGEFKESGTSVNTVIVRIS